MVSVVGSARYWVVEVASVGGMEGAGGADACCGWGGCRGRDEAARLLGAGAVE